MKRNAIALSFTLALVLSAGAAPAALAQEASLYNRFDGKAVKVFVAPAQDATAEKVVDGTLLKTKLEEALKERKSIRFQIVPTEEESEITIESSISEYVWSDTDPIDMLMGVGGAAMDAAVVEDYARLQANVTVKDTKSKRALWQERVMATVTKKPMSQIESIPLVAESFGKSFVKNCFSKTKK